MVRELADLSLVKHMLSRSEESHNRQLPFGAIPTTILEVGMMKQKRLLKKERMELPKHLQHINQYAAGIDIGSRSHFVAVPEGVCEQPVRDFPPSRATLSVWQSG